VSRQQRVYPPADLGVAEGFREQIAGAGDVVGRDVRGAHPRVLYTPMLGLVFVSGPPDPRRERSERDLGG
jgi:hypothetical protein